MKFLFVLLALTPLVYCATLTHEEQFVIQTLTETQKRALLQVPTLDDLRSALCKVYNPDDHVGLTCLSACPLALNLIPYGSLAGALCRPACASLHC